MTATAGTPRRTTLPRFLRSRRVHAATAAIAAASLFGLCVLATSTPATSSGYIATVTNSANQVKLAPYFTCATAAAADKTNAVFQYALNEASGASTAVDSSPNANTGTYRGTMTSASTTPLACSRDTGGAYVENGTNAYVTTANAVTSPTTFTEEVWFKTTVAGGRLLGFGTSRTGTSVADDRHLYIDTTGKLDFGTLNLLTYQIVQAPTAVTDGKWHHVVATMSSANGMRLYLDGALVASNAGYTTAQLDLLGGYWRVGADSLTGWPNAAATTYFAGSLRFAAVYTAEFTATQVLHHYVAGS